MTKKEAKKEPNQEPTNTLTEVTIGKHTIPVVASLDELPRVTRRRVRNAFNDTIRSGGFNGSNSAEVQALLEYVTAYSLSQGVRLNIEGIEDDAEYDRTRNEAILAGLQLFAHFSTQEAAGDEGKADAEPDEEAPAT